MAKPNAGSSGERQALDPHVNSQGRGQESPTLSRGYFLKINFLLQIGCLVIISLMQEALYNVNNTLPVSDQLLK